MRLLLSILLYIDPELVFLLFAQRCSDVYVPWFIPPDNK